MPGALSETHSDAHVPDAVEQDAVEQDGADGRGVLDHFASPFTTNLLETHREHRVVCARRSR